jgi:hypothetical protein
VLRARRHRAARHLHRTADHGAGLRGPFTAARLQAGFDEAEMDQLAALAAIV